MDMNNYPTQWGCPYCSRLFPSREDVKKHLEPNKQLIIDLLSQLQQALSPSCQQLRETTEGSITSEGGNDVDLDSTKQSHAEEPLRCPHSDCEATGRAFNRRDHLLRHYKTHVVCNVVCECGNTFDVVDRFEKHVKDCQIILKHKGGSADHEKEYKAILGTKKVLNMTVSLALNEKLKSLKSSQSEKATKSSSSTVLALKRKRSSMTVGNERETSHQEDSMLEDCNGAVHLGSLRGLDSITSYTNTLRNSTSQQYPNESTNDPPLAENTIDSNSLTHESNNFGHTRPSQTGTGGGDWSHFYAGDSTTNQDQWDFGSMNDSAHRNSSLFSTASGDGLDWYSFYASLDDLNNVQASELWTDARGQVTNI